MQLFLFLNDLAGRWPLLDGAARWFYVGALPLLGTLVGAQLLLLPRPFGGASRSKTALALALALALGALLVWGLDAVASAWHLGNVSPRPWMTRRVNWLVVEPQDNSFPSTEVLFAFVLASASLLLNHRIGFASVAMAVLCGLTRMFCGNNYFADVAVAALLGTGLLLLCAALVRRHVSFRARARGLGVGSVLVAGTLLAVYVFAASTPRFAGKLALGAARAAATTSSPKSSLRGAPTLFGEGDESAASDEGRAEQVALAERSTLFLPGVEAYLRGKLAPLARPLTLLDVEVAPVKAGTSSYRCAEVRFGVDTSLPDARRVVADCAGRLTRATFELDSQMQNVDIICVTRDQGRNLDGSQMVFTGDEVPVFTGSVQRKNVVLSSPAWLNAPGLDGGMWLRARSRLYINDRVLPVSPSPSPTPSSTPPKSPAANPPSSRPAISTTRGTPQASAAPSVSPPVPSQPPVPSPRTSPSSVPSPTPQPSLPASPLPSAPIASSQENSRPQEKR